MYLIKLEDIVPADYNPRKISEEDFKRLENSISEFGLVDPIIINLNNNRIIGGHQRYDVLLANGVKELNLIKLGDIGWCFADTDLKVADESHEKALNLALNKISGEWDNEKLNVLLDEIELSYLDIELTGFEKLGKEVSDDNNISDNSYSKNKLTESSIDKNYSILVHLSTQDEQEELYETLSGEGYDCTKN